MLIVGPDGSGKSTLAQNLHTQLLASGHRVVHTHFLPQPQAAGATSVTAPHQRKPRGRLASDLRVAVRFVQFWAGYLTVWRLRASTVTLIERGWWDQLVDPLRYRNSPHSRTLTILLGRCLPKADLAIICIGDPAVMSGRKQELPPLETARQIERWKQYATVAARESHFVDTTSAPPVEGDALLHLLVQGQEWRLAPCVTRRVQLRYSGKGKDAVRALRVYQPAAPMARLGFHFTQLCALLGVGARTTPPVSGLERLTSHTALESQAAASISSNGQRAHVVRYGESVLKIAHQDDQDLRSEYEVLLRLPDMLGPVSTPAIRETFHIESSRVIAFEVFHGRSMASSPDHAIALETCIAMGNLDPRLVHGDFAPWNLLASRDAYCLIDWQRASFTNFCPGYDLIFWHLQTGFRLANEDAMKVAKLAGSRNGWLQKYCQKLDIRVAETITLSEERFKSEQMNEDFLNYAHRFFVAVRGYA